MERQLEEQLRQRLLERGLVDETALEACQQAQQRGAGDGKPAPLLAQLLLLRGLLSAPQIAELFAELKQAGGEEDSLATSYLALRGGKLASLLETTAPDHRPQHPDRLGKYQLLAEIGRGGMGRVYRARDPVLGRLVAVKVLRDPTGDALMVQRLHREAKLAASLSHPNLIPIFEVGQAVHEGETVHYIAMEFIEGRTLDAALEGQPLRERVELLAQTCEGVGHAHAAGVIHRDLKPANVLVREDGRAVVMDFGLARDEDPSMLLTVSGQVMGTPAYMAPEQITAESDDMGPPTDVWALGVMLYDLLVRCRPFMAENRPALFNQILSEDPEPPRLIDPEVPADLDAVCLMALRKETDRRYANAGAMATDLRRWLAGESVVARPPSRFESVKRRLRRNRVLWISWALFAILAAGLIGWALTRGRSGPADAPAPASQRDPARERELLAALSPFREQLENIRALYYVPQTDFSRKRAQIERTLEQLDALAARHADSQLPDAWLLAGMGWYFNARLDKAEAALEQAARRAPRDPQVQFYLGSTLLYQLLARSLNLSSEVGIRSQFSKELKISGRLRELAAGLPEGLDRHLLSTWLLAADRQGARASAAATEGLKRFGNQLGAEEYWLILACLTTDPRQTLSHLDALLVRRPHHPWALLLRSVTYTRLHRFAEAGQDADAALRINPRLTDALEQRGVVYVHQKQYARALPFLTRAVALGDRSALVNLGATQAFLGRLQEAEANLRRAARLMPEDPGPPLRLGNLLALKKDYPAALAQFEEAQRLVPGYYRAVLGIADTYRVLKRYPEALRMGERAIALQPRFAPSHFSLALTLIELGRRTDALKALDDALRIDPDHTASLQRRGAIRSAMNMLRQAHADFDRWVALAPKDPEAWFQRGMVSEKRRRYRQAVTDYSEAIRLDPKKAEYLQRRAACYSRLKQYDRALADVDRGIALAPRDASLHARRGNINWERGDRQTALTDLARAVKLDPRDWTYHYVHGLYLSRVGRRAEAAAAFRKSLPLAPASRRELVREALKKTED